ncbi:MAG: DNA polymerase III subunit delta [Tannerella sp.]|jgi:DNA polymerase-3 subunit delta'|nr:DNA polymerase III subunit delta [Tannerella sp.]
MYFKDIIGQEELKRFLTSSARKGVVPHALMFCGNEGYGSFALAFAFARYINCTDRSETDACGKCPSCLKYSVLAHPDLHFVFPMVKKDNEKTDQAICDNHLTEWRQFLNSQLKEHYYFNIDKWLAAMDAENKQATIYSAESESIMRKMNLKIYEADYRVLFIWMPERMQSTCANKLLKLIEEPFPNTAIIMVSANPDAVLGTIFSRSQLIHVKPLPQETLVNELVKSYGLDDLNARQISHLSEGSMIKAVKLLSVSDDETQFLGLFMTMMRNGWARNVAAMKTFAEETSALGREKCKVFLAYSQRLIRENFLFCLQEPSLNYLNSKEASFSVNFSKFVHERNIFGLMEELSLAEYHIARNVNAKMVFFDLSMRITALIKK